LAFKRGDLIKSACDAIIELASWIKKDMNFSLNMTKVLNNFKINNIAIQKKKNHLI